MTRIYEITSAEIAVMLRKAPAMVWDPACKRWVKVDAAKAEK